MRARVRRPIFAITHVIATAFLWVVIVGGWVVMLAESHSGSSPPADSLTVLITSLSALFLAVRLWLEVKRLHDIGWSSWWAVAALAVTIGLASVPKIQDSHSGFPAAITLAWFLVLAIKPGEVGSNRDGPAPRSGFALFGSRPRTEEDWDADE